MASKETTRYTLAVIAIAILFCFPVIALLFLRLFVETRYIPSTSMQPTLKVGDRLLIDKHDAWLHNPFQRGDIIVFYPPPIALDGEDIGQDLPHILGRLTGLPIFPNQPAFIKRVIAIPGERVKIVAGDGVYVNGKKLPEPYIMESANYSLQKLTDIHGHSMSGKIIEPYSAGQFADKEIIVPPNELFILGDDRNRSEDSHTFGLLKTDRIVGRAFTKVFPLKAIETPRY
ncbi:MAG: signal peptidase I [Cyanobacteria bacterium REEB67]|nr:signal peptidase I [Cyanobacteria bacterium REEB67]